MLRPSGITRVAPGRARGISSATRRWVAAVPTYISLPPWELRTNASTSSSLPYPASSMTIEIRAGTQPRNINVTTIILSRGRTNQLKRALRSLSKQQSVALDLIVVIDDCPETASFLRDTSPPAGAIERIRHLYVERDPREQSGPARVARLRELGLEIASTNWTAFLDDDNELEPGHYSNLLRVILEAKAPAAHSWRSLWSSAGKRHLLTDSHPWCQDREDSRRIFRHYESIGVYKRGSEIVRDQVVPHRRDLSMVDTSEWLFQTNFLRSLEFCKVYTRDDWLYAKAEDSKLLDQIVQSGTPVPSSRQPTLRYFLGGYSNNPSHSGARLADWVGDANQSRSKPLHSEHPAAHHYPQGEI